MMQHTTAAALLLAVSACGPSDRGKDRFAGAGSLDQEAATANDPAAADLPPDAIPDAGEASGDASDGAPSDEPAEEPAKEPEVMTEEEVLRRLPEGQDQLEVLCARPGNDRVRRVFCADDPPQVASLVDLQRALGLAFVDPTATGRNNNGRNGNPGFTLTGHSSSLVGRFTSAINPRVILFTPPVGARVPDYVSLGFVRGEQLAEIVANDPDTNVAAFFLVRFEQKCNEKKGGCTPGELLTPAVESNWTGITIYEDEDLKNTVFDCRQCHQPGGDGTPKMLRMQELRNPWTHFFRDNTAGGRALTADFVAAHGADEDYGGIPAALIPASDPGKLEDFVRDQGFGNQPAEFPTRTIEREVTASSPQQPTSNAEPGVSATWQALYERAVAGTVIAIPYHDVKVTDPAKLVVMTSAYQAVKSGAMPVDELPDIRNVLLERMLPYMGFGVKPGLDGAGILQQACAQCHNSQLSQNITRARFNVDLTTMSRKEKDLAIQRLRLPAEDARRMPPARFRSLTEAEIELLTKELMK